jgi:hypothetical protein
MPIWSPERGRIGERIFNDPDDERATKTISIEDTAYWFAENNGEWRRAEGGYTRPVWPAAVRLSMHPRRLLPP